jgi:hypothetical protein
MFMHHVPVRTESDRQDRHGADRTKDGAMKSKFNPGAVGMLAVLAALVLTAWSPVAEAQGSSQRDWNNTADPLEGAVGLHYGKLGGHGLAFRLPLEWWLYFQVAGGIWHTGDHKQHNVGFQLDYLLRQDDRMRIYVAVGAGYFYDDERVQDDVWEKETNWNLGAGVGMEILQGRRWSWQVEGNFVHDGKNDEIKVAPQMGIYYYW